MAISKETMEDGSISGIKLNGEDFPHNLGDHASADAMLAHELNQLSVQERDLIEEEIHGIRYQSLAETPEMIQSSLENLAVELDSLPSKEAYDASKAFPESYIHTDDDFRLMFLRRDFFDAQKAAVRMSKYLDLIRWAFGEDILQRQMSLADLDSAGERHLKSGAQQVLPGMDRSGRRIVGVFAFDAEEVSSVKSRVQSAIYLSTRLAQDSIGVQQKGAVGLMWTNGWKLGDMKLRFQAIEMCAPCLPIRFSALHCCIPPSSAVSRFANAMYLLTIGTENRKRVRVHSGSATECLYKLQTFGIRSLQIPINTNTGKVKSGNHLKWIEIQRRKEEAMSSDQHFNGVECPEQKDILFGRGWPKMSHPGNAVFRSTIEARLDDYNSAKTKRDKTMIAWSIVCDFRASGARFLREDSAGWWVEVSNETARQKVSIGFRDIRKAILKASKANSIDHNNASYASTLEISSQDGITGTIPSAATAKRKSPDYSIFRNEYDSSDVFTNMDGSKRKRQPCTNCMDNSN